MRHLITLAIFAALAVTVRAQTVYVAVSASGQPIAVGTQTQTIAGATWYAGSPRAVTETVPPGSTCFGLAGQQYIYSPDTWAVYAAELSAAIDYYARPYAVKAANNPAWADTYRSVFAGYIVALQAMPTDPAETPTTARAYLRQVDATVAGLLSLAPLFPQ